MNEKLVFLSEGKMNLVRGENVTALESSVAESYKKKLREINSRNEWKKSGVGARFMGVSSLPSNGNDFGGEKLYINGLTSYIGDAVAYSLNSGNLGGLYVKSLSDTAEADSYILVSDKTKFYDIDFNRHGKVAASFADSPVERHLALINTEKSELITLTEGESFDANPAWSAKDGDVIYYDSCGVGYDSNQNFMGYGSRGIFRLDTKTGELSEILADGKYDFYKPFEDADGNLFFLRRPHNSGKAPVTALKDVLLIPFKVFKAFFGWLNFFTQRYSGESLRTNGGNPAKLRQKSPEQIFIDGNLLDVEKNLSKNESIGEKNPGYVPSCWELIVRKPDGEVKTVKKGVLDYCLTSDGLITFSNGKYIIKLDENGAEEVVAKAHLASRLVNIGDM